MLGRLGRLFGVVLAVFAALVPVLAGRLVDGYTAYQWTCYHAAQPASAGQVRKTARWASRVVERVAPLPLASGAASLALQSARTIEPRNREAAIAAYGQVRTALEGALSSRVRGFGLAGLAADAAALEGAARPGEDEK